MGYVIRVAITVVALLTLLWPASVQADVLELKNGQKLEGQYAGGSKDEVRFQVGSQALKFPIGEVSRITMGNPGQEDFRKAAIEALRQLKALASVAEGGTTYQDYARRVSDAKIKVDQFLDEYRSSPLSKFNEHIADSLGFYVAASSAWNVKVSQNPFSNLAQNPYILKCAPIQEEIAQGRRTRPNAQDEVTIMFGIPRLWECARNSVIDAEKALGR